jgi:hypothetical protein
MPEMSAGRKAERPRQPQGSRQSAMAGSSFARNIPSDCGMTGHAGCRSAGADESAMSSKTGRDPGSTSGQIFQDRALARGRRHRGSHMKAKCGCFVADVRSFCRTVLGSGDLDGADRCHKFTRATAGVGKEFFVGAWQAAGDAPGTCTTAARCKGFPRPQQQRAPQVAGLNSAIPSGVFRIGKGLAW